MSSRVKLCYQLHPNAGNRLESLGMQRQCGLLSNLRLVLTQCNPKWLALMIVYNGGAKHWVKPFMYMISFSQQLSEGDGVCPLISSFKWLRTLLEPQNHSAREARS